MPPHAGRHALLPHPASEKGAFEGAVEELSVEVDWSPDGRLALVYRLLGDMHALQLPPTPSNRRTDGLWRHTCFEAFIARAGASPYWEFNLSPSGAWAAYQFSGYREGMAPLMQGRSPVVRAESGEDHVTLEAVLDLSWLERASQNLKLGLAAIIEDRTKALSYWALAHPAAKPDFHHADGLTLDLV